MGLEVVLHEIQSRGSQEEQAILRQADAERQAILNAAEGEADDARARALAQTRSRVEALRREQQSANESEVRRRILTAQAELAADFRKRVLAALGSVPAAQREKVLNALAKKAKKDLPKGKVHARKDDLPTLVKAGFDAGNAIETPGGFQVESPDASVLLDYRFDTIIDGAWKDILVQNRALFEG